MGAAAIALGTAAVSTGFSLYGQKKAQKAQKEAAQRELQVLEEQKSYLKKQKQEQLELLDQEAAELFGNQASAFAVNNIDLSGSALSAMINDKFKAEKVRQQVSDEFDFNIKIGGFKQESINRSLAYSNKQSKWNTATTILGGVGQAYSSYKYMGGSFGRSSSPTQSVSVSGGSASQQFSGSPNNIGNIS